MVIGKPGRSAIIMEEVTDPDELERARAQREQFDRNWAWLEAQTQDLYELYRGTCICISEGEIFAADTAVEVIELAKAAHPKDAGRFTLQIPREKAIRIYAC